MDGSTLISIFGDSPRMRVFEHFMEFPLDEFTIEELADLTDLSDAAVLKEIKHLEEQEMINSRPYAKSLVFRINRKNPINQMIQNIVFFKSDSTADRLVRESAQLSAKVNVTRKSGTGR